MTMLHTPALVAEGGSGGFHTPSIADFFPHPIWFEGTIFEITRLQLVQFVAAAALITVMVIAAKRVALVPGRFQNVIEMIFDFVRVQVVESIMGKERGRPYIPLLTTIFVTILAFNLTGVIPGLNLAGTARVGVPLLMALWVFYAYWAAGIRKHGFWGYLKANMFPPGVPWFVYPVLAPIELLQILIIRPASLIIRLLANMVAGHIMLALCLLATNYLLLDADGPLKAISAVTFVGGIAITLFEVFVAGLQAFIFALLAAVYINMSLDEEH